MCRSKSGRLFLGRREQDEFKNRRAADVNVGGLVCSIAALTARLLWLLAELGGSEPRRDPKSVALYT
jgi:hypothetical protein